MCIRDSSNTEVVTYDYRPYLNTPELSEPFNQSALFMQSTKQPLLWLEWKAVPDAFAYDLELARDEKFEQQISVVRVPSHRFLLRSQLPIGKVFWRVRAVSSVDGNHNKKGRAISSVEEQKSNWAKPFEFVVSSQKNEVFGE